MVIRGQTIAIRCICEKHELAKMTKSEGRMTKCSPAAPLVRFAIRTSFGICHWPFLLHRFPSATSLALGVEFPHRRSYNRKMLHLIWYLFVGFLAGCVAKALMHMHLSITWTIVLGMVGSIIGGAVTHLFYPPSAGGKFHLGGLIVSIIGAILVLYVWHKFRLQLPRG
jgi:uncharacterized membrane protein YeaQ/YmgE (transglycosylase-associated protein family)